MNTGKKALLYAAGLIGIYLAVSHGAAVTGETSAASTGLGSIFKTLQGR